MNDPINKDTRPVEGDRPPAKAGGKFFWVLGALCLLSIAGHLAALPFLPDTVPCHWGINGEVDGWMSKYVNLLTGLLPLGLLLLFRFLPAMEPKREVYTRHARLWHGFVVVMTVFLIAITWMTECTVWGLFGNFNVSSFVFVAVGIVLIALGNYMPKIGQNYTFGCKTPWALADEHCWHRTQRMGGFVFVGAGTITLICALLPTMAAFAVMMTAILGGTLWIFAYSFLVFKGKMK